MFVAHEGECRRCNPPPPPPPRMRDPKNWKEEWHAQRNAEALLEEDILAFGEVTVDAAESASDG